MTISIDTNVIVALWWHVDPLNHAALHLLNTARKRGPLVITAPVYAELLGDPQRSKSGLDRFLLEASISVDWEFEEPVWREAGRAYQGYVRRRRLGHGTFPRRILADFLIGAHALACGYTLLTLDKRLYAAAFPKLRIISA